MKLLNIIIGVIAFACSVNAFSSKINISLDRKRKMTKSQFKKESFTIYGNYVYNNDYMTPFKNTKFYKRKIIPGRKKKNCNKFGATFQYSTIAAPPGYIRTKGKYCNGATSFVCTEKGSFPTAYIESDYPAAMIRYKIQDKSNKKFYGKEGLILFPCDETPDRDDEYDNPYIAYTVECVKE